MQLLQAALEGVWTVSQRSSESLRSISFACKDAMLEWEWLGTDMKEWPPQRLDWEVYCIERLSFVSNMESSFASWLSYPWHIGHSALRCMACKDWQSSHVCPKRKKSDRNTGGVHNPWAYLDGCLTHLSAGTRCIGSLFSKDSPGSKEESMIPSTADLIGVIYPSKCIRDFLPPVVASAMSPSVPSRQSSVDLPEGAKGLIYSILS